MLVKEPISQGTSTAQVELESTFESNEENRTTPINSTAASSTVHEGEHAGPGDTVSEPNESTENQPMMDAKIRDAEELEAASNQQSRCMLRRRSKPPNRWIAQSSGRALSEREG